MTKRKIIWIESAAAIMFAAVVLGWLAYGKPLTPGQGLLGVLATSTETGTNAATTKPTAASTAAKRKNQDVVTIVRGLTSASTFNGYFRSTGVAATIAPKSVSKYTIFVPTNGAFAQLAPGTISIMTVEEKKRLVQHHVIAGRAVDMEALSSGSVQALSGDPLNFTYKKDEIPMVNSALVVAQYEGTNGVVIVIDNVLLPPKKTN